MILQVLPFNNVLFDWGTSNFGPERQNPQLSPRVTSSGTPNMQLNKFHYIDFYSLFEFVVTLQQCYCAILIESDFLVFPEDHRTFLTKYLYIEGPSNETSD